MNVYLVTVMPDYASHVLHLMQHVVTMDNVALELVSCQMIFLAYVHVSEIKELGASLALVTAMAIAHLVTVMAVYANPAKLNVCYVRVIVNAVQLPIQAVSILKKQTTAYALLAKLITASKLPSPVLVAAHVTSLLFVLMVFVVVMMLA
jgi:hypothetical protein